MNLEVLILIITGFLLQIHIMIINTLKCLKIIKNIFLWHLYGFIGINHIF